MKFLLKPSQEGFFICYTDVRKHQKSLNLRTQTEWFPFDFSAFNKKTEHSTILSIGMKKNLLLYLAILIGNCQIFAQTDDNAIALQLVRKNASQIGISNQELNNVIVSNTYYDNTSKTRLVYLQQSYLGLPVYNQLHVLAFRNDQLVSKAGSSISGIEKKTGFTQVMPKLTADMAVLAALKDRKIQTNRTPLVIGSDKDGHLILFDDMGVSRESITAELMWVPAADGKSVALGWQVYIIQNNTPDYWMVRINAIDGTTLDVNNFNVSCNWDGNGKHAHEAQTSTVATSIQKNYFFQTEEEQLNATGSPQLINNATYKVIPYPAESPIHTGGTPAVVSNPWTNAPGNASSLKWHNNGSLDFTYTRGNNVWAQEDRNGNNGTGAPANSTTAVDPLNFEFTPSFTVTPTQTTPVPNQQFNITNLFYWNNILHDVMYQYGFDEVGGNFQNSNQGRGGQENDYVLADAQDGSGTNNANFATPADGSSGRMQMYLWSGNPQKDGDVDNGVVCHEFAHGISNRLTGGPAQAGCLSNAEQMGEGWSDYYGLMFTQNWATATLNTGFSTPRGIGTYAAGQSANGVGIRSQKYSTNFAVNNKVYAASIPSAVHDRGEIWCATLWDMTWNIINQVGSITTNLYDANGTGGNVIAFKLVTMGMKLQPCSPGFIDGRDAILRADEILYNGAHKCAIWEAFRRRGMGANASQGSSGSVTDQVADFTIGKATLSLTQSVTQLPEGNNITYYNTISTDECGGVTNFILTDTLPSNVTYVSGGTYNAANRVVSFPVTLAAGQTQVYSFTVQVNTGAYFPTVDLFGDQVTTATIPTTWTATNTRPNGLWTVSNARSFSPDKSYFSNNLDTTSDQRLILTNPIALGATPPPLTFRHWYNTESTYDGGVLEVSTNGGTTWTDMQPNIQLGGYIATMDATTLLNGRRAWSGSSNGNFIKTKVNLTPYANQSIQIRFRFTSDVGTNLEGWYVDDIAIKSQAVVEMQSNLYSAGNVRVGASDTFAIILPPNSCAAAAIVTPPTAINACAGNNATFSTSATGDNLVYQWQISTDGGTTWTNISGATANTYSITNVTTADNNNRYRVIASNNCPSSVTSAAAILTVGTPAAITSQPVNQTTCGSTIQFTSTATGTGLSYQWQVSNDGGITFTDITGATASNYPISGPSATLNNNQYHVIVTGCNGSINSSNATLTVNSPAAISTQPANAAGCEGSSTTITTAATGTGISYQWQVSTDGGITWNNVTGATTATLSISNLTASMNNYKYRVLVSSSACPGTVTSAAALLTVGNTAVINTQPTSITVCENTNATFSVNASGSGLTYQWQVSNDGGTTFINIAGATENTYSPSSVSSANGNIYHVIVSSACSATGLTSSNVTLNVTQNAAVTAQPNNANACPGNNAIFSATATGTGLSYQWQISVDGGTTYTDISGATLPTYTLINVSAANNNNKFRVLVSSTSCNSATSDAATLTVITPANITAQPTNASGCINSNLSISVAATGTTISYQWQVSTDGGVTFTNISGANNTTLALNNVGIGINGNQYRVIITEATCGAVTSLAASVTVNNLPQVSITASPSNVILPNQTITLTASSSPSGTTYNWYNNGTLLSGQTGTSITVSSNGLGSYYASYTDPNGCEGNSNNILVKDTVLTYTFIYPNPNNGEFFVRFEGVPMNGQARFITLYDEKGARVYRKGYTVATSYEPMKVTARNLSAGNYALVLSDASGVTLATGKVVIQ